MQRLQSRQSENTMRWNWLLLLKGRHRLLLDYKLRGSDSHTVAPDCDSPAWEAWKKTLLCGVAGNSRIPPERICSMDREGLSLPCVATACVPKGLLIG